MGSQCLSAPLSFPADAWGAIRQVLAARPPDRSADDAVVGRVARELRYHPRLRTPALEDLTTGCGCHDRNPRLALFPPPAGFGE